MQQFDMTGWWKNGTEEVIGVLTNFVDLELVELQKRLVEKYCEYLHLSVYLTISHHFCFCFCFLSSHSRSGNIIMAGYLFFCL
jgi:hypothetical protein